MIIALTFKPRIASSLIEAHSNDVPCCDRVQKPFPATARTHRVGWPAGGNYSFNVSDSKAASGKPGRTAWGMCDKGISLLLKRGKVGAPAGQQSAALGFCAVVGKGPCEEAFLLS